MLAYLQGLSLGLAYVAPIGVQNLFVINAGLSQPRAAAYRTALIVIFFDVTLALAGFFGIGALIEHSELIRKGVLLAGSLVVMYMGLRLMLSREVAGPAINVNIPLMKTIGMACSCHTVRACCADRTTARSSPCRCCSGPSGWPCCPRSPACSSGAWSARPASGSCP